MKKQLRKLTAILLSVQMVCSVFAAIPVSAATADSTVGATSGTTGDCTWTLDGTMLTISGNGDMDDYILMQSKVAPWYNYRQSIKTVIIASGVTKIGAGACVGCSSLVSVTISDTVTRIGRDAFKDCSSLTSITIPDSVTAFGHEVFAGCSSLNNITLSNSVTELTWYEFAECTGLTSVVIPESVTGISIGAFSGCTGLTSVTIPKSMMRISDNAFYNCGSIKDVYYNGTKEDWEKISIGADGNEYLLNANIHYVDLDALMGTDPTEYNNELAEVAARLSLKTYDNDLKNPDSVEGYLQYNLGFDKANIHSRNFGNDYAFTIATKEYSGDDADEILVVVAQGTTTIGEKIKDYVSKLDYNNERFYGGYAPYQVVSAFYSEIVSHDYSNPTNLYSLTKQDKRYKILVTGHSLGGAAANLLAAQLTARRHIGGAIGQSDVFCYTFGAIDSIRVDSPIVAGYENIHNVYNELDTLSPTQFGRSIIGKNGIFLRNGKFGVIESFAHDYRTPEEKLNGNQLIAGVNHAMNNYLEAIISDRVKNSTLRPGNAGVLDLANSYSVVGCPVDIDVYCNGELVGRVVNNVVDNSATSINIFVDDDVKFIVYPDNLQYDLRITAFDEGTMVYYTQNLTGEMRVKTISNVALTDGKIMTSAIGEYIDTVNSQLFLVDKDNNHVSEILTDGREVDPIIADKDLLELNPNEIVTLTAHSEDSYRWYSTDESVATIEDGIVTAVSKGEANIIAETENGARAICKVKVIPSAILGDINNDGKINGADAGVLNRYVSDWAGYADKIKNPAAADINGDGNVNGADAGILSRYVSGWTQYAKYFN